MWKPVKSYEEHAIDIIEQNKYCVVATSGRSGKPWAAPVFYAFDDSYDFYFVSATDSLHARNIAENRNVALEIFDSRQSLGATDQVQISGIASVIERGKELEKAVKIYHQRLFKKSNIPGVEKYSISEYSGPAEFRVFKVKAAKAYTNGPDRRIEIKLKKA